SVSAKPAGAVSGCRYGPMRENPGLAATVPVAPWPALLTSRQKTAGM
ncbi:TPA: hypothetical protein J1W55_005166, partial [Escherichia coli]|nr:hypothetical protein [Escherichia coli]